LPTPSNGTDLPEPTVDARQHSDRLTTLIREEIRAAGGWIAFARFMELALYAPGLGFYVAGATKLGADGDFVTAPEISSLFGRTLARQIGQLLETDSDEVLELGAGSGVMAADILGELQAEGRLPRRYLILEPSPQLAQRQRETLRRKQPALCDRVEWSAGLPENFDGVIVGNEVLDALPVHVVAWRKGGLFERGVGWQDGFVWVEQALPPGELRTVAESVDVAEDYVSEISLAAPALVRSLADTLRRGALLLIDYGFGQREFFHPQRSTGTLMCHYRHRAHEDAFFLPGLQDLTAHVDFTAVAGAGIDAGLKLHGYTTQAHFLINCGITGLLEQPAGGDAVAHYASMAGAQKLLSPAEMGELFKVIALGRGVEAPLIGFSSGDKSRLL
jgi:SAM-dependent MidA family methyltransferase